MKLIPQTKQEWLSFCLFPFKAFVVVVPIVLFVWLIVTKRQRIYPDAAFPIALGFISCIAVFVVTGLIQLILRRRQAALSSLGFAGAALLYLYWVGPMCAS